MIRKTKTKEIQEAFLITGIIVLSATSIACGGLTAKAGTGYSVRPVQALNIIDVDPKKVPDSYVATVGGKEIENVAADENKETEEEQSEDVKPYTEEELYILSHIICGEAQGYPDELQIAVGSVFLNRVKSPKYPNTFKEVAFQKKQYGCIADGNYYREPTSRNIENAIYLLENGSQLPEHVIFQSEVKQGRGTYKVIKLSKKRRMYFCY